MWSRKTRQGRRQAGGIGQHRGWRPREGPRGANEGAKPRTVVGPRGTGHSLPGWEEGYGMGNEVCREGAIISCREDRPWSQPCGQCAQNPSEGRASVDVRSVLCVAGVRPATAPMQDPPVPRLSHLLGAALHAHRMDTGGHGPRNRYRVCTECAGRTRRTGPCWVLL